MTEEQATHFIKKQKNTANNEGENEADESSR